MQSINFKKLSSIFGKLLVFLSFVFLFFLVKDLDFSGVVERFRIWWIPLIIILAIMYGFLSLFLALGWRRLLELSCSENLDKRVVAVYLKTVIYKYIPGNIFHFLGRHSIKDTHDISHKTIAFANGVEIILQLLSVIFIIFIGSMFFNIEIKLDEYFTISKTKVALAFALLVFIICVVLFKKKYREILLQKGSFFKILFVLTNHVLFLLGSAIILFLVYYLFFDLNFTYEIFFNVIFVGLIAWLLGFIVPGAPGGVGIREAVLLMMLPGVLPLSAEIILAGALIYRVITILGEVLTLVLAKLVHGR